MDQVPPTSSDGFGNKPARGCASVSSALWLKPWSDAAANVRWCACRKRHLRTPHSLPGSRPMATGSLTCPRRRAAGPTRVKLRCAGSGGRSIAVVGKNSPRRRRCWILPWKRGRPAMNRDLHGWSALGAVADAPDSSAQESAPRFPRRTGVGTARTAPAARTDSALARR